MLPPDLDRLAAGFRPASAPRRRPRPRPPMHVLHRAARGRPAAEVEAGVEEPQDEQHATHRAEDDAGDGGGFWAGILVLVGGGDGDDFVLPAG